MNPRLEHPQTLPDTEDVEKELQSPWGFFLVTFVLPMVFILVYGVLS